LVDSSPGVEYSSRAALRQVLPDREFADLREWIGPPIRAMFRRKFSDLDEATLDELERAFRASYDRDGWQKTAAYPGVAPTLARLAERGVKSFVVTNKPSVPTRRILEQLQLDKFFTEIVTPDSKSPPFTSKAEGVSCLLTHYFLNTRQTLLVGDSEDDDRAAQACGVLFLAAAYGYGDAHHGQPPARILSGFESLLDCLAAFD
jgi:phosphoglycolate phosphatase